MKKHELIFSVVKIPLDTLIIVWSFFIARQLRLATDLIPWVNLPIQTIDTLGLFYYSLIWAAIFLFFLVTHGLYSMSLSNSKLKEWLDIIRYSFYSFVFFAVIVFLGKEIIYPKADIPRLIFIFSFSISTIIIILERIFLNNLQSYLLSKNFLSKKNLLIISNKPHEDIAYILEDIHKTGIYHIIWYANKEKVDIKKIKYIGWVDEVRKIFEKNECDEILYIESDFKKQELYNIWELSRIYGVRYRYITNNFDVTKWNTELSLINSIPVIEIKNTPLDNWGRVIKRISDIILSIFWIALFLPLMLIIAIFIKIEDKNGPIIYKNRRVWQNGKIFNLYKFRYIKREYCVKDSYGVNEDEDEALRYEQELIKEKSIRNGPLYKIENDPRKTKTWSIIEKYSLDEIPQFFNVFLWNMSLVGPRPHQPREVEKYDIDHKRLLTIKPWITWMAQVNGRETNDFNKEAQLDIFYIENWSLLLDLKIIFKTFYTIISRK